jgi:hypothetical protein
MVNWKYKNNQKIFKLFNVAMMNTQNSLNKI